MENKSNPNELRKMFLSVLSSALASDHDAKGTFLQLLNIFKSHCGLLIPLEVESDQSELLEMSDFICSFLGKLLVTSSSEKVLQASRNLQTDVLKLIASRNRTLFPKYIEGYLNMGDDAVNILYGDVSSVSHHCFQNILAFNSSASKPIEILLQDNKFLDHILITINDVLGNLGSYLMLYGDGFLDKVWIFLGRSLEIGSTSLKLASLMSLARLIDVCDVPRNAQTQYYIVQLIGSCTVHVTKTISSKGSMGCSSKSPRLEDALKVSLRSLRLRIVCLFSCVIREIISKLCNLLECPDKFSGIKGDLLKEILLLICDIIQNQNKELISKNSVEANVPRVLNDPIYSKTLERLEDVTSRNMRCPQVVEVCLPALVAKDLSSTVQQFDLNVKSNQPRKRTFQESEFEDLLTVEVWEYSRWWRKVVDDLKVVLKDISDELSDSNELTLTDNLFVVQNYMKLASKIIIQCSEYSKSVNLSFIPSDVFPSLSNVVLSILTIKQPKKDLMNTVLTTIESVIFVLVSSSIHSNDLNMINFLQTSVGVCSLPWLVVEMNWLDLNCPAKSTLLSAVSLAAKNKDLCDNKSATIPILCLVPRTVAPSWRCWVVRSILGECNENTLSVLASWLPVLIQHLPPSSGRSVLESGLSRFLNYNNEVVQQSFSKSLKAIICSASNTVKISSGETDTPFTFFCPLCDIEDFSCVMLPVGYQDVLLTSKQIQSILCMLETIKEDQILLKETIGSLRSLAFHNLISLNGVSFLLDVLASYDEDISEKAAKILVQIMKFRDKVSTKLESLSNLENTILEYFKNVISKELLPETYYRNQRGIQMVLSQIVHVKDSIYETDVLLLIVPYLVSTQREIYSWGNMFINRWCHSLKMNPKQLYLSNAKDIAKVIVRFLGDEVPLVLSQLAETFSWGSNKEALESWVVFGKNQLPHILPPLILQSSQNDSPSILVSLSDCLSLKLRDCIIDNFQYILPYLVFHCSLEEKEKVLSFIPSITNIPIKNIRKCSLQDQVNILIYGLNSHRDAVLNEFLEMKLIEGESNKDKNFFTETEKRELVAEFLGLRLLGILGFVDGKLLSSHSSLKDKQEILLSLSDLLRVLRESHVSPVARKVLASLKGALMLQNQQLRQISCKAWTSFLNRLDENTLESIIEEVVVLCLPLLKEYPEDLAPIFQRILLEIPSIKSLLKYIPVLPSHSCLSAINEELKRAQEHLNKSTKSSVIESLDAVQRSLTHESQDLRIFSLKKLRSILKMDQDIVQSLILDTEKSHKVVSDIFTSLLSQCRENEKYHLLVAECLGLFGAIDPSRLLLDTAKKSKLSDIYPSIDSESFVLRLVLELSRAFLATTNAQTQTCASYAMQEILKIFGIGPSTTRSANALGASIYSKLPPNVQEMTKPLQNSRYMVQSAKPSALPVPIYGSNYSKNFNRWVTTWACSIVDCLKEEKSKKIFSVCKPIIRRDSSTALVLLPPLIVCALSESPENIDSIAKEFLAVLGHEQSAMDDHRCNPSEELQHLAAQTIFSCLDYLRRWSQEQRQMQTTYRKHNPVFTPSQPLKCVFDFLDCIPSDLLAKSSFRSQAYSRALLHIEEYLNKRPDEIKSNLSFIQSIYVALDDPDGVAGIAAVRQDEPTLREQIIEFESMGRLQDALGCYEQLCIEEESAESYGGTLLCLLALGQPQSVLNITHGLNQRNSEIGCRLHEYQVEAAWRLGQWDCLGNQNSKANVSSPQGVSWGSGVGKAFLAVKERKKEDYMKAMSQLRIQQITPLSAASMEKGAYQRCYPFILRLQILKELDEIVKGYLRIPEFETEENIMHYTPSVGTPTLSLSDLVHRWNNQLTLVQTSHRFLEPLLNFRRVLLNFARDWTKESEPTLSVELTKEIERLWLQSAKVARKAGHLQQGELTFYGAGHGRNVFMERAKWHWAKGEQPQAVTVLKRGIEKFFPDTDLLKQNQSEENLGERRICAQAKLLLARYSEVSATLDVSTIKIYYREACEIHKSAEDAHFHLAMYYDRILTTLDMKEKPAEWLTYIVQSFGKSLNYGSRHLYQSMPRLLSIWLDHGAKVAEMEETRDNSTINNGVYAEKLAVMNNFMITCLERLPSYMFLIALPQLISRICHSHHNVFVVLCKIIAALLSRFPQQAMWHMIAVSKSSYQTRRSRCLEIFQAAKRLRSSFDKFIFDATKLADMFIELSEKHVEKGIIKMNLRSSMRSLSRLLSDPGFSRIIIPLQQLMNVTLPLSSGGLTSNLQSLMDHEPFPRKEIFICGIEDEVEVMQSLVQPKKITLRGSDGQKYILMCKPKDDMRKDCRLMEFNSYVNRLLRQDPESRKRDLKIRTYMVVPLNEECGLIEWIPNLSGLRHILHKLYKENGTYTSGQELKSLICQPGDSLVKKRDIFINQLLPRHPPVLYRWFLLTFVDPQAWLQARWLYCRTTAVMSMVGYIVGLGDRHGENILFDSESGDTVHVDFNCLFNKGETFDWPERVPFRLTHNMTSAMGPMGYEGIFRKSCEVTMRVMRKEKDELMSVLKPFIYDPLVEWEKWDRKAAKPNAKASKDKIKGTGEICNAKAQTRVKDIEERLSGHIRSKSRGVHLPLSVEGQVNVLIEDSTSVDNLCQMFIGWAPFM